MYYKDGTEKFLNYCKFERGLDFKTIKAYKIDLSQYEAFILQSREWETKGAITSYVCHLYKTYKPKTAKRKLAVLKAYFNYLEYEELMENNPFNKIRLHYKEEKALPKIIDLWDIEKILGYAHKRLGENNNTYSYSCNLRNAAILELLFATGARISEICSLKISDVNLKEKYIKIYGKGAKERIVAIPNKAVISVLKKYSELTKVDNKGGYFFVNRLGNRYSEQSARNMINFYAKECNITQHITPHMFRHSFATYLLSNDVDIRYIQHLLGHSSIATTQIYTHISNHKEESILSKKHPRNNFKI